MCVIIYKPASITFPKQDIEAALHHNSDGFGYMFVDDGRVLTSRTTKIGADEIMGIFKQNMKKDTFYHLRHRTHGDVSEENCHPFEVMNKEQHGVDLFMMHNGTIPKFGSNAGGKSDTLDYIEQVLQPILQENPKLLFNTSFQKHMLLPSIGGWSRIAFLNSEGEQLIVRKEDGKTRHGCWVSNDSYFSLPQNQPWRVYNQSGQDGGQGGTSYSGKGYWKGNKFTPQSNVTHINHKGKKDERKLQGLGLSQITEDELKFATRAEILLIAIHEPHELANIVFDLLHPGEAG
jgi:hypothetical protein